MSISKLEREEKLRKIINHIKSNNISMYAISKATGLSDGGINRIVNKTVKTPNINTLNLLYSHLFENNKEEKKELPKLCKDGVCFNDVEIAVHVATNESDFMKIKIFENIIERNVANRILDILKDGKLKEFLT